MKPWKETVPEALEKMNKFTKKEHSKHNAFVISKDNKVTLIDDAGCIFIETGEDEGILIHLDQYESNGKYVTVRSWPSTPDYKLKHSRVVTRCNAGNLLEVGIEVKEKEAEG